MSKHDPGSVFRALHQPGNPFILANAWDVGSARMLAGFGAKALATSSSAHAFTLGRPDNGHVSRDEALAHAQSLVEGTPLPVSGDFENGFGKAPDHVAETVRLAAEVGLAGISIEDTDAPGFGSYDFKLAVERIKAAVAAARALKRDFVLVARADGVMNESYDMAEALRRIRAFDDAGADCLFVPVPPSVDALRQICQATKKPVNALAVADLANVSLAEFGKIGVARISQGSAVARLTHKAIYDAGKAMFEKGDFSILNNGISGGVVDELMEKGEKPA